MNSKQEKTLQAIISYPASGEIAWADIESLLLALGAEKREGQGSRVGFKLKEKKASFHRPHPQKEAHEYQVKAVRDFLRESGVIT